MINNTCWLFANDVALPWIDAHQYCLQRRGYLAVEHDAVTGNAIRQQVMTYGSSREYWFGLRQRAGDDDDDDDDEFIWINDGKMCDHGRHEEIFQGGT